MPHFYVGHLHSRVSERRKQHGKSYVLPRDLSVRGDNDAGDVQLYARWRRRRNHILPPSRLDQIAGYRRYIEKTEMY